MKFNLLNSIIKQIENNVKNDDIKNQFIVSKMQPVQVINVLVREGAFKIDRMTENSVEYIVQYKDLDLNCPRLKHIMRWDKSMDRQKFNDANRFEDARAFTTEYLTDYDGAYCPDSVDYLEYTDSCTFDMYVQMKGYTVEQMLSFVEAGYLDEQAMRLEYIEFLENCLAKDYEVGEDFEEEYQLA